MFTQTRSGGDAHKALQNLLETAPRRFGTHHVDCGRSETLEFGRVSIKAARSRASRASYLRALQSVVFLSKRQSSLPYRLGPRKVDSEPSKMLRQVIFAPVPV